MQLTSDPWFIVGEAAYRFRGYGNVYTEASYYAVYVFTIPNCNLKAALQ